MKLTALALLVQSSVNAQSCYTNQGCQDYSNFGRNASGASTLEYDNFVSSFHSTIVRDVDGNFRIWGENSKPDGSGSFTTPTIINKTNFSTLTGTPLKAAAGSNITEIQHILLTSDNKLWIWGNEGAVVDNSLTTNKSFQNIPLPSGVSAADVKMIFATTGTLVITTCPTSSHQGAVFVLSKNETETGTFSIKYHNYMRGDGYLNKNSSGTTTWAKVQKSSGGDLTNIVATRGSALGLIALDASGNLWTWGNKTYDNVNNVAARGTATALPKPATGNIKMIGATADGGDDVATYYVLYENGNLYSIGDNSKKQLGNWTVNNSNTWLQPKYTSASGQVMNNVKWISPQEHDNYEPFINVISGTNNVLFNWGSESRSALGRSSSSAIQDPGAPSSFSSGSNQSMAAVETGGHTTMILRDCETKFGYVGHKVNGSMGSGNDDEDDVKTFSFLTASIQVCGAITAPSIRNDQVQTYCKSSSVNLIGQPAGGTFTVVSGPATISGNTLSFTSASGTSVVVNYTHPTQCGTGTATFTVGTCKSIAGKIWNDANGDAVIDPSESGTNNGGMFANLVDPSGKVVASVEVDAYGNYYIPASGTLQTGTYKIIITNNLKTVGSSLNATDTPENGYKHSGTNVGGIANGSNRTGVINLPNFSTTNYSNTDFGITNGPLAVSFGSVTASINGNDLLVNWISLKETNNSHFEIEASTDGENFTKIGEVLSQAKDGNSSVNIEYSFTKNANGLLIAGFSLLALGGLGFGFSRRKKLLFAAMLLAGMATVYTGCSKNNDADTSNGNLYVRVVQVDKDGSRSASKVVKVNTVK